MLSPFTRVRRLEFADLPKTPSGKLRRRVLQNVEISRTDLNTRHMHEYWEEDFPDLRKPVGPG
jgi:acetyl-CoA synthetase